jgi:hypothetical protein
MPSHPMKSARIFIISWAGQHENAVHIARQLARKNLKVFIVFSDPDPDLQLEAPCELVRRPDELFWGDKFQACMNACGDDPMLVIHADCTYEDWGQLVDQCHKTVADIPMIGVWAPLVDWVPWTMKMVEIAKLNGTALSIVTRTDGIVFYLSPQIIQRMRLADYADNVYGRGIELMSVAASYARGRIAVIDRSMKVQHPKSTGYPEKEANDQFARFIKQLTPVEEIQRILLSSHMKKNGGLPLVDGVAKHDK